MRDAARTGLAVGFFDGVHLGHQAILRGASAALTFRNHPLAVLAPERAPRLIMSCEERTAAIRACGVEEVTVLDFTPELASLPPEAFVDTYLRNYAFVRCGANWHFGKGGRGTAAFLQSLGLSIEVVPYAEYAGERISSSRIRACLERGALEDAQAMMGRRFTVSGKRVEGKGLGRQLGYPTINLNAQSTTLNLPLGVYAVELSGHRGIANYGLAPTMGEKAWREPVLEVHLLDAPSSAFTVPSSATMTVEMLRFIRPERTFSSLEELKRQIAADCQSISFSNVS